MTISMKRIGKHAAILTALSASLGVFSGCADEAGLPIDEAQDDVRTVEQAFPGRSGTIETRVLRTEKGEQEVQVEVIDGYEVLGGDMLLSGPEAHAGARAAAITGHRWPGATIPYKVDPNLPHPERVDAAIARWEAVTPVRFIPYTNQSSHVLFMSGSGCSSYVGKQGWAEQGVRLSTGEGVASIVGIGIAHSDDHVYYWYRDGFVTSGTSTDANVYRAHYKYELPIGETVNDVVDFAIASDDHVYVWFKDGTVSAGTSSDLDAYRARYHYTTAAGKTPNDIAGIGIAGNDHVYVWYKDGTVSSGTTSDLDVYQSAHPYTLPAGQTAASINASDIAGSNDHVYTWFNNRKVSSGTSTDLDQYIAPVAYGLPGQCGVDEATHEIGHALGLFHEQSRHDRDSFVTINWGNIEDGQADQFDKYDTGLDIGAYDFDSVMHYDSLAFSKNGLPTITRKDGSFISRNGFPSAGDIFAISFMY